MKKPIPDIVKEQHKGKAVGVYSVCSSHPFVLEAAMLQAAADETYTLVESTSNQVDQFGGYTGMTPSQFVTYIHAIADSLHFPRERVFLGGDHLGPNPWKDRPAREAMELACELVTAYVEAGFSKIHLDASMRCADDPGSPHEPLPDEVVASRAAQLCVAAERACCRHPEFVPPVYVIGTEVPIPGGATSGDHGIDVTSPADAEQTIAANRQAFIEQGLEGAWDRVVAVVVQPGVEFGDDEVIEYSRENARPLSRAIERYENLVFEAHSTDYQRPESLAEMVRDHFAILKVGPALTFACREALFALEAVERELQDLLPGTPSGLSRSLEAAMLENSKHWAKHYSGKATQLHLARRFSYSDRSRYYWPVGSVSQAVERLLTNLATAPIPATLLSQYLPSQYQAVRDGRITNSPKALILSKVREVLDVYSKACLQGF